MKKGSHFTRIFSQEIRRLETTGTLDFLRKRYSGSPACKPQVIEMPLGFEKLSFLFVMLIFGCIMSILVLLLEYKTQTKKQKQELTSKDKDIEEEIGDHLEVQGLSIQENDFFLDILNHKPIKNNKEETKLNVIKSDDINVDLVPKNCPSRKYLLL